MRRRATALHRDRHIAYVRKALFEGLPTTMLSLDASRPWIIYWSVHTLALLGAPLTTSESSRIAHFLRHCQSPSGGFGGGPGQLPHLATTYAAVSALVTLGTAEALGVVNR